MKLSSRMSVALLVTLFLSGCSSRFLNGCTSPRSAQPTAATGAAPPPASPPQPTAAAGVDSSEREIVVALDEFAPAATLTYLAQISRSRSEVATADGTLGAFARTELGDDHPYIGPLTTMNAKVWKATPAGEAESWPIHKGQELSVPDLDPTPVSMRVTVAKGESASAAIDPYYSKIDTRLIRQIEKDNKLEPGAFATVSGGFLMVPRPRSIQVIRVREGLDFKNVLAELRSKPGVELAADNHDAELVGSVAINANVLSSVGASYDLSKVPDDWFVKAIHADQITADDLKLSHTVPIAVIDSGLDFSHKSLIDSLWNNPSPSDEVDHKGQHGLDFRDDREPPEDRHPDSHGTHVAGIASGAALFSLAVFRDAHLERYLKLMVLRVANDGGGVELEPIMAAFRYADANAAKIIVASWRTKESEALGEYFRRRPGLLSIVASGNGEKAMVNGRETQLGVNLDQRKVFPASYKVPQMIAVGALDPDYSPAFFSNFGPGTVHILAPGMAIKSTIRNKSSFGRMDGTSHAAPFVALAAALMFAKDDQLNAKAVKDRLLFTGDMDLVPGQKMPAALAGRLNLVKAIAVNVDLVELKDEILRGEVQLKAVLADSASDCGKPWDLAGKRLNRVIVRHTSNSSLAFIDGVPRPGWICNKDVSITTASGAVTHPLSAVKDIVWRSRTTK